MSIGENFSEIKSVVKNDVGGYLGQKVVIQWGHGAHRVTFGNRGDCIVDGLYPDIFTLQTYRDGKPSRKLAYSYVDVMTNGVQLKLY